MVWTTPRTWVADEIVTETQLNEQLRDNLSFLHTTHGPLWLPAPVWSNATFKVDATIGSNPDSVDVVTLGAADTLYLRTSILVPDDWISSGFTAKIYWFPADAGAGNVRWEFEYFFVSAGSVVTGAGTPLTPVDAAAPGTTNELVVTSMGATAAPAAGQIIRPVMRRNGVHANDTYAANAYLWGVELEFT